MAMLYITFIQLLLDQGVVAALVQRRGLSKAHLDSTFWMNLVMCVTLAGTGVLMAPWWARINRLPELENIVIVLSASILIQGFAVVQRAHLQREMAFKQLSIRSNVSVVIGGAVGLACAVSVSGRS
jgi:PST family polysaccharide transporter